LTLVAKKSPFAEVDRKYLEEKLMGLTESTKPNWGILTPQHMVEHFDYFFQMSIGEIPTAVVTPEKYIEKYQEGLWTYKPMIKKFDHPDLKKGELEDLRYGSLAEAKKEMLKSYDAFEAFFKENPEATTPNTVFGDLDKFHWDLLNRKHVAHHFRQFGLV